METYSALYLLAYSSETNKKLHVNVISAGFAKYVEQVTITYLDVVIIVSLVEARINNTYS